MRGSFAFLGLKVAMEVHAKWPRLAPKNDLWVKSEDGFCRDLLETSIPRLV